MELGISKFVNLSSGPTGGALGGPAQQRLTSPAEAGLDGQQDSADFSAEALSKVAEFVVKIAASAIKGLLSSFGGGDGAPGGAVPGVGAGPNSAVGAGPSWLNGERGGGASGGLSPMASFAPAGDSAGVSGVTGGGAEASVEMAKKYQGNSAISLKGKLANYTAAGGTGNDCADFVSAILANTQGFKKKAGDASVATFKQDLVAQGWKKVDKAQSKAGDVVIFNGSQHTELVTKDGGKEAIGSNGGETNQSIKTDSLSWGTQEFYHKG